MQRSPDFTDAPDATLVASARAGHPGAFEVLVNRHFNAAYAIAYARLRHREAAEDVAQETFLRAYLTLSSLKDDARFGAYAGRIARNLSLNWRRDGLRASRLAPMVPLDDDTQAVLADDAPSPRENAANDDTKTALMEALQRLPEEDRELVVLHFLEELSQRELAQRTGLHHVTVGRRLGRAVAKLRGWLGGALVDGEAEASTSTFRAAFAPTPSARARAVALVAAAAALSAEAKASLAATAAATAPAAEPAAIASITAWTVAKLQALPSAAAIAAAGVSAMTLGQKIALVAFAAAAISGGFYASHAAPKGSAEATLARLPVPTRSVVYNVGESQYYEVAKNDRIRVDRRYSGPFREMIEPTFVDLSLTEQGELRVEGVSSNGELREMLFAPDSERFIENMGAFVIDPEGKNLLVEMISFHRENDKAMFGVISFNRPDLLEIVLPVMTDYREGRISRRQVAERIFADFDKAGLVPADATRRKMMRGILEKLN